MPANRLGFRHIAIEVNDLNTIVVHNLFTSRPAHARENARQEGLAIEPTALDQIPLFAELSAEERARVAECMREVDVEAGTQLARQGDWAYELFVIQSGEAEVRRNGEVVIKLGAGDVFGEIGLLATGTRTATVIATSPMRLAAMFLQEFKRLERSMPSLVHALRQAMAERALGRPR